LGGLRLVRLLALFVCGVAVPAIIGVAPALSKSISYMPEGIHEHEDVALNYGGNREREPEFSEPPGYYVENYVEGDPGGGDGIYEYTEECEKGNIFEHCEGLHTVIDQNSEGILPSGFVKLEHAVIDTDFEGYHSVANYRYGWKPGEKESELFGPGNPGETGRRGCHTGKPVNCATGNETTTQTDLVVGGRGPALNLIRTYNSHLAAKQTKAGPFGFGWTGSYSAHLELTYGGAAATVYQDDGSTVTFTRPGKGLLGEGGEELTFNPAGPWSAPSGLVEATLADEGSGYVYTLPNQIVLHFNEHGELTSEADRDGNTLTMGYESGHLVSVTDAAGRKLTLAYNAEGEVESAKDPMGHTIKYVYEGGNLKSVTQPAASALRWQFKYNSEHEMILETDGRSHAVTMEYNGSRQVISQTDALSRKREWKYKGTTGLENTETTITEPNGAETVEQFNVAGEPTKVTRAHGVSGVETMTEYEYNSSNQLIKAIHPNKHVTEYGYDSEGNKTSEVDPNKDERKWKYDKKHNVATETTPEGETTTTKREAHGNPEVIERPAPSEKTQKTTYKYDSKGDVESVTDPLEHTWKYEYDYYGDRKSETDPEGNKRTWEYNEDSQETATISPRGNIEGAKPAEYETTIERDARGRPLLVTGPEANGTSAPVDKTAPSVSGAVRVTQTLNASTGIWEGRRL
jgi:YD repeat-containing protein